jgi:hypothetical protein
VSGVGRTARDFCGAAVLVAAGLVLAAASSAGVAPWPNRITDAEATTTAPVSTPREEVLAAVVSRVADEPLEVVAGGPEMLASPDRTTAPSPDTMTASGPASLPSSAAQPLRGAHAAQTLAPAAATCPATWFCFPRVGVAGPIVPYADCSGSSEVGSAIRSFTCVSSKYLVGHAYTQFGLIRQWAVGDIVFAYGVRYSVSGAITQSACSAPVSPLAPLSLQTSLGSGPCGAVLVVQAR